MFAGANRVGRQLFAALPSPFLANGEVDGQTMTRFAGLVNRSSADGAFVAGTTGEFLALEQTERRALVVAALQGLGDKRLVVHIGAPSVRQCVALARDAADVGVTEMALMTPLFLPTGADAVVRFFDEVARGLAHGVRLYAYLFRVRTNVEVSPGTLRRIASVAPLVGVKVSGESLETCVAYKEALGAEFEVFTGTDGDYGRAGVAGLHGVVSGVASCLPEVFDGLNRALGSGDGAAVAAAQTAVRDAVGVMNGGDIARIKATLRLRGMGTGRVRMPMDEVSEAVRAELAGVVERAAVGGSGAGTE